MKKILKNFFIGSGLILVGFPLGFILLLILLGLHSYIDHNLKLKRFSEQLYSYPIPSQTKLLEKNSFVGLTGNGNHCDYLAEMTIETQLNLEQVELYYRNLKVAPIPDDFRPKIITEVSKKDQMDDDKLVIEISIADVGNEAGFDLRCR